jgi:hypothetical protein
LQDAKGGEVFSHATTTILDAAEYDSVRIQATGRKTKLPMKRERSDGMENQLTRESERRRITQSAG